MRHDPAARKRAKRSGRERGAWVYIPAEQLEQASRGEAIDGGAPFYSTWTGGKGRVTVQLYARQDGGPARRRSRFAPVVKPDVDDYAGFDRGGS